MPAGEQPKRGVGVQPVRAIEAEIGLGIESVWIEMNGKADEILGLAHQQRKIEALAQPAGETDVVGMVVSDQGAGQRTPRSGPSASVSQAERVAALSMPVSTAQPLPSSIR